MTSMPTTKLAEVFLVQELAERWAADDVVVNAIHPGLVDHTRLLDEVGGSGGSSRTCSAVPQKRARTRRVARHFPGGGEGLRKVLGQAEADPDA